jgi:hypothetical protein
MLRRSDNNNNNNNKHLPLVVNQDTGSSLLATPGDATKSL